MEGRNPYESTWEIEWNVRYIQCNGHKKGKLAPRMEKMVMNLHPPIGTKPTIPCKLHWDDTSQSWEDICFAEIIHTLIFNNIYNIYYIILYTSYPKQY